MRLFELISDNHRKEIVSQFKSAGYKKIGQGIDAMVFKKDDSHVAKIIFPRETTHMDLALRTFMEFYNFCKNNPSKHLPKFSELNEVEVDGEVFTQIIMEKLNSIPNGSVEEAMVWILSDIASKDHIKWKSAVSFLSNEDFWDEYKEDVPAAAKPKNIVVHFKQNETIYEQLYNLMKFLYKTGKAKQMGWDLHTENVMQRKDGTLVIVDPWMMV